MLLLKEVAVVNRRRWLTGGAEGKKATRRRKTTGRRRTTVGAHRSARQTVEWPGRLRLQEEDAAAEGGQGQRQQQQREDGVVGKVAEARLHPREAEDEGGGGGEGEDVAVVVDEEEGEQQLQPQAVPWRTLRGRIMEESTGREVAPLVAVQRRNRLGSSRQHSLGCIMFIMTSRLSSACTFLHSSMRMAVSWRTGGPSSESKTATARTSSWIKRA